MEHIVPLELLKPGETGRVIDVGGDTPLVSRLGEMGLRLGSEVRMVQPGRPCIIAIANQRLSFRAEEAGLILVEVCPQPLPVGA